MKPDNHGPLPAEELLRILKPPPARRAQTPEIQSALVMQKWLKKNGFFVRRIQNRLDVMWDVPNRLAAEICFKDGFCTLKIKLAARGAAEQLTVRLHEINGCLSGGCLFPDVNTGEIYFRQTTFYGETAMTIAHCQTVVNSCADAVAQCRAWLKDAIE